MNRHAAGLPVWLVQRLAAVYILLFVIFLPGYFLLFPIHSYSEWRAWVAKPGISIALAVFFLSLLSHMWVGLRDVLFDYARPPNLRPVLAGFLGFVLTGMGAWLGWILVRAQA